jgi:hypothetical protein
MKYLFFLLFLKTIFNLHFELQNDNEKCFVDEFFENTVVILHYEILNFDINQRNGINQNNPSE